MSNQAIDGKTKDRIVEVLAYSTQWGGTMALCAVRTWNKRISYSVWVPANEVEIIVCDHGGKYENLIITTDNGKRICAECGKGE